MNFVPRVDRRILAVPFLLLSFGIGPMSALSIGDVFAGIWNGIVSIVQAIWNGMLAIGNFFAHFGSPVVPAVSHGLSQTYTASVNLYSDARSYVSASISHAFQFDSPIQSVNVSLTMFNVADMQFHALAVTFTVQGKSITIPVTNFLTGPNITVDSGPIILPSPVSFVGITADIAGTLCGSSCSNVTFTPQASLTASVPPSD